MQTRVDHVENMSPELIPKGRETLIVKIAINRVRQPPSPGLCSLSRTVSGRASMNKHGTDFLLEKPHMHFFIFQNRGQIRPQAD
jgi:hypothetical protein